MEVGGQNRVNMIRWIGTRVKGEAARGETVVLAYSTEKQSTAKQSMA